MKLSEELAHLVAEQKLWILEHGGDLAGYIKKYGSANDADKCALRFKSRSGKGGEAIYQADINELRRLENRLAFVSGKP